MYALTHAALAFSPGLAPSAGLTLRGCSPVVMMGTRDEFAFGKDPRVIGFRGGTASGMEEPYRLHDIGDDGTERNDFAFGKILRHWLPWRHRLRHGHRHPGQAPRDGWRPSA